MALILFSSFEHVEGRVIDQLDESVGLSPQQKGVVLMNELGCVSCHSSSQNHFKPRRGPDLSGLGSRVKVDWLKGFLKAPYNASTGSAHLDFPIEFEGSESLSRSEIENALVDYLISTAPTESDHANEGEGSAEKGDALFHSTGCVVCHGASSTEQGAAWIRSVRHKFHPDALHALLLDPLKTRPDARMPDMHLTHDEASDLTAFIMNAVDSGAIQTLVPQPAEEERGGRLFGQLNCNACHDLEGQDVAVSVPDLEAVRLDHGCLTAQAGAWPQFTLSEQQKTWIRLALQSEIQWTPSERIKMQMAQFNCYACHERDGIGGVTEDLNASFASEDPNLGEQGRLPPHLDGVGAKLNVTWLRKILVQGAVSRPYMKTRMPRFGAGILDNLIDLFVQADAKRPLPDIQMPNENDSRRAGRDLAGTKVMACITCHAFKGTKSGAMAAVDMALMGQRLTPEWFHHYLAQPQQFSPGTLMPDFWPGGHSTQPEILDGNTQKQIQALWVYLSDGYSLGNPEGLHREPMRLVASNQQAVMLRRSYPGVGKRGIGVGLPQGFNYVFHAEQMGLSMLWKGEFGDPAGVWLSQGHGNVRPLARDQIRFPNQPQWQMLSSADAPWFVAEKRPVGQAFKGYRLDKQRRPTFLYEVDGNRIEDTFKEVLLEGQWSLKRNIQIQSSLSIDHLIFRAAVAGNIQPLGQSRFQVGEGLTVAVEQGGELLFIDGPDEDEVRVKFEADSKVNRLTLNYQF